MDNKEDIRRYYDDGEDAIMTSKIEKRTPNEIADDNFEKSIKGIESFQEELYRKVLSARGINPDEVNIEALINGEITMDEVAEKYKSNH